MKFHEFSMRPAFNSNSYLFPGAFKEEEEEEEEEEEKEKSTFS